jgi:hypothetical protein
MQYDHPLLQLLERESPASLPLAEAVSCAVLIEPQLLRTVRIKLLPQLDVGAEADVWLSPIVESRGPDGIVFQPAIAMLLRQGLRARSSDRFEESWKFLQKQHAYLPVALRLEEEIYYHSADTTESGKQRMQELLAQAAATIVAGEDADELAYWAAGLVSKLPSHTQLSEPVKLLATAAYIRLCAR